MVRRQDVLKKPMLTMQQEFAKDHSWTDWKGVTYSLAQVWDYVNGRATRLEGCTPGTRDANNDGKAKEDFLCETNDFIRVRRSEGCGTELKDTYAFLTMEEILAVRLYDIA